MTADSPSKKVNFATCSIYTLLHGKRVQPVSTSGCGVGQLQTLTFSLSAWWWAKFVKKHERRTYQNQGTSCPFYHANTRLWIHEKRYPTRCKVKEWYVHGNSTASLGSLHLKFSEGCYHAVLLLFSKFLFSAYRSSSLCTCYHYYARYHCLLAPVRAPTNTACEQLPKARPSKTHSFQEANKQTNKYHGTKICRAIFIRNQRRRSTKSVSKIL